MMKHILLSVEGMSCTHCVNAISKALKLRHGVRNFKVSLKNKTVLIEYDEVKVTIEGIQSTLEEKGYDSVVV